MRVYFGGNVYGARAYYYLVRGRVDRVAYKKFFFYTYIYIRACMHTYF